MYLPEVLASSGGFGNRIVELYIKRGIFQTGAIDLNGLLVEVNTFAGKVETTETALHLGSGNKVGCINAGIGNLQFVDDNLATEQGHQLDINNHTLDIGDGVFL